MNTSGIDRLIGKEVQGTLIHESKELDKGRDKCLGFLIDRIFASYKPLDFPAPDQLTVPLKAIRFRDDSLRQKFSAYSETSHVPLYDAQNRCWNWPLHATHEPAEAPAGEPAVLHLKKNFACFLNTVSSAIKERSVNHSASRYWVADWSERIMPSACSNELERKPDLVLLEHGAVPHDEVSWGSLKVIAEHTSKSYTNATNMVKTLDTTAGLILVEQPWRRFVLALSFANLELRVHFYDRSGGSVSPPFHLHSDPEAFVYVIAAVTLGCRSCIGFDRTVEITSVDPLRRLSIKPETSTPSALADDTFTHNAVIVPTATSPVLPHVTNAGSSCPDDQKVIGII
jgi:hypothetical protein